MSELQVIHRRSKKNKNIVIRIKDGDIVVSRPWFSSLRVAERFVEKQKDWIEKQLAAQPQQELSHLDRVGRQGIMHIETLETVSGPVQYAYVLGGEIRTRKKRINSSMEVRAVATQYLKKEATALLKPDFWRIANKHQVAVEDLRIKDIKTRWGSCSSRNAINLNIWLLELPTELAEYVICHELAHIAHKNHSKEFWELVERYNPQTQAHKKLIKQYQARIFYVFDSYN